MLGTQGFLGLFQGDPEFNTLRNIKSKPLGERITSLMGDWDTNRTAGQNALADYIAKYMGGEGAAATRTSQEIGALDPFFNGGMSSTLAGLRNARARAMEDAANTAALQAIRSVNQGRLSGYGGPSSYDTRLMTGALIPIRQQAALDRVAQERADLEYLTNQQIGLAGRRQELANAMAGYGLVPEQVRRSMYGMDANALRDLIAMDQANTFYGLQQHTTDLDKWINFMNDFDNSVMNLGSLALGAYTGGMMGGQTNPPPSYSQSQRGQAGSLAGMAGGAIW